MNYQIIRKNIKSIIIRVDKNGVVKVSAPKWQNIEVIDNFVHSQSEWIESRLKNILKFSHNAIIPYFEQNYTLLLSKSPHTKIIEQGDTLQIYLPNEENAKKIVSKWYEKKSKDLIDSIVESYKYIINREVKSIRFREMTTRWGSCNYKRATITLNTQLFSKPKICLEYILLHELIHLLHPNHQKEFYTMQDSLMPNWREVKKILESSSI